MSTVLFAESVGTSIEQSLLALVDFLPALVAAILVLVVGHLLGQLLGKVTQRVAGRTDVGERIVGTPAGALFDDDPSAVTSALGTAVYGYVLLIAAFVATDRLGFQGLRSWFDAAIGLVPAILAGLAIIVLGIVFADYVGDVIRASSAAEEAGYPDVLASVTTALLYLLVIVIGLETMGFQLQIVYVLVENVAFAFGVAVALALGLAFGLAFGLGAKDYVAENVEEWVGSGE